MRDSFHSDLVHRAINRLLAFADAEYTILGTIIGKICSHPLEERPRIGQQTEPSNLAVLRSGLGSAADHDSSEIEVDVVPG